MAGDDPNGRKPGDPGTPEETEMHFEDLEGWGAGADDETHVDVDDVFTEKDKTPTDGLPPREAGAPPTKRRTTAPLPPADGAPIQTGFTPGSPFDFSDPELLQQPPHSKTLPLPGAARSALREPTLPLGTEVPRREPSSEQRPASKRDSSPAIEERPSRVRDSSPAIEERPSRVRDSSPAVEERPPARREVQRAPEPPTAASFATIDPPPPELPPRARRITSETGFDQPPPPIDPIPLEGPAPEGENTWLTSFQTFKAESQKLARVGLWRKLAAMTGAALLRAPYARRMTRNGMLLDLARIYRDRLGDQPRAEQAFAILADEDPANAEALAYLVEVYEKRGEWGDIYDLYLKTMEATWDPNERLACARKASEVAAEKLLNPALSIKAWEQLWNLGDAVEEASRELARHYRLAGRWNEMAGFLEQQAERQDGAAQLVTLRELAEVKLSGQRDPDGASKVLERIVERSPKDPIATLQLARVYAQRKDWSALERLGQQAAAAKDVPAAAAVDLQHLVADSLWQAGRLEQAIAAYDRILAVDPADHDGTNRKREFLTRTSRFDELLALLESKAESIEDDDARAEILAQAAQLAEEKLGDPGRAAALWERRIAIDPEHLASYEALARLYEPLGDLKGIARAYEGQLGLTRDGRGRIRLLMMLGEHYASRMGDDERAEGCWKEILSIDPTDLGAREELIKLHRRRGDFESLNSALLRQIWLTTDLARAERLSRTAAENLDENFQDPPRSVEAWRRVLDYAPLDQQALQALERHYAALERRRESIGTLERQILAAESSEQKIERALRVARLWTDEGDPKAAAATFERILHWDPANAQSLEGLVAIYRAAEQPGKAAGVLEHAAALTIDGQQRIELLRRVLDLLPADDHVARFFHLRRILELSTEKRPVVSELYKEAEEAKLWPELAAVLTQLACTEPDARARVELLRELASLCEKRLENKERALQALEGVLHSSEHASAVLADLTRLAKQTKRFEDLLAILDRFTTSEFDADKRKEMIRQRAALCEKEIKDAARAFHELRRLIELDPTDWAPLADLERLAGEHGLWRELDAVFAELGDRTGSVRERLDLLARRERIAREKLNDRARAFDLLVRRYRLDMQDLELLRGLTEDAEALGGWGWLLPILEATQLYVAGDAPANELAVTAALYESKLDDHEHAFTLYTYAFVTSPGGTRLEDKLEALAERTRRHEILADTFRMAAAVSSDRDLTVELLRRIAAIYEQKLSAAARAIDIHRRLLALKPDEVRSLEVMIEWHRGRSEWRDLRDRLRQWCELTTSPAARVPKLLEIAQISEQYLSDPETALSTFGEVLELDAENAVARQGLNGLVVSITEPGLRLRWLQMELRTAAPEQAGELRLEIAQIQEEDLGEIDQAIGTLRELVAERGPAGPGFAPLRKLLEKKARWKDLVLLLQSQAGALDDPAQKRASLDQAIAILHEHFPEGEDELREALYRSLLVLAPGEREIRMLLARLLRRAGRFEELATHLLESAPHVAPADRRAALYELARIQGLNLGRAADAEKSWKELLGQAPGEEAAVLALARAALLAGDLRGYVGFRQQQAKLLPPHEAALVLCHLAETCDENEGLGEMMVPLYREARTLDPNNVPAMEALKGIGRRLKNLRPAAALLPFDGERELAPSERAKRLKALGDGAKGKELAQAIEWYWRAAAVDPDTPAHWTALCDAMELLPNPAGVFRARRAWLEALDRSESIEAAKLPLYAERMYQVAIAARTAGQVEEYATRVRQAYEMVPHHAPSALSTAQAAIEARDVAAAHKLLHTILSQHRAELSPEQQMMALYSRGLTLRELSRQEEAMDDVREALRIQPLHADALCVLGEMQALSGRVAAAIEHQIRALMVVQDPKARARLCHRLGVLWEDGLANHAEAGACYELALAEGLSERDLLHRALRHFQRTGRLDQSLEVVNGLLPTATDPEELATLWLVRGEIFAAREGYENEAIEAFDMALSYNPARQEARDGLVVVLERRGDYRQLLQVLEAACDVGTTQQQSSALLRMAEICRSRLDDAPRAEEYLRRAVMAMPTRDALEQLEQIYTVASGRLGERRDVLGHLVAFGPPFYDRVLELSRLLLGEEKTWAWCLISPLLGVSQVEADIKAVVQAMRKEYERPPTLVCSPADYELLRHAEATPQLTEVLAEMGELLKPLGISTLDQAGDGGAIAISEGTSLGKAFAQVAGACGMGGCGLFRTQELPESVCVVNADPHPMVVVRTEVMQQLVHAEVGFLFAYALELAKPGHRVMAALSKDNREQLVAALWLALGFIPSAGKIASKLADRIREAANQETRDRWAEQLSTLSSVDPIEEGRRWWRAIQGTARRAGLVAGADLRQVFRVVSRLEPEIPRPRVVARLDELDEYIGSSEVLRDLVAFAASPAFGKVLAGAAPATE